MNKTMMTDLYELTMSNAYFKENKKEQIAVFDVFFRKNALNKGYSVMGGLHEVINFIKNIHFTKEDIDYLRNTNLFDEEFLNYLKDFKFTGDIYAIPDGTAVFPNEAILTVKAPIIEAQIIETIILSYLNSGILYTTASKRITEEAKEIPVMEFGARRALGPDTAVMASTDSIIGGCSATSNVLAGKKNNIPIAGTFAHSFVTSFDNELDAFISYANNYPNNCILLVDTYDVINSGIPNAIKTAKYLKEKGYELKGIRIDSGNLVELSKKAKQLLVEAGFPNVKICLSNGLDEKKIKKLKEEGAVVDSIGLGDNIVLPNNARVGCVYKEVAIKDNNKYISKIKRSNDIEKTTTPGYKKIYRLYDKKTNKALGDVISLNEETLNNNLTLVNPKTGEKTTINNCIIRPLQETIFKDGELVYKEPSIKEKKEYCKEEIDNLKDEIKKYDNYELYKIIYTEKLYELKKKLLEEINNNYQEEGMQYVKKR